MVLGKIRPINIEDEIKRSYLDYAMSVIVSRALPDVRDGLKPVHRRILYAMQELGLAHTGPYRKSARVVGDVLGKYHPHGDTSVYDAMVRMAQDFSMRYMLVDGQGNFGSVDNDPPAAMRYTEVKLAVIAQEMLVDIGKDTVDFMPNFDASLQEPTVLPARLPNLLVNGSSGIAVGMATNIPPHNLSEVSDAIGYLIDNPEASINDLIRFVKGPDFPTAGIILGQEGIRSAYATGHGKVVVQARATIVESPDDERYHILVTELPYQVNKAALIERIAELVKDHKVRDISEVRDESDRQGMRIVVELRRGAQPNLVLNTLYKYTPMQSAFFINMLALVDGQPRILSLKEALQHYIDFRFLVITRRSQFDLKAAKARAHILEGLKIALDNLDLVIKIIRSSPTAEAAREGLMTQLKLSQLQAQAILDLQLRRLASLERQKIIDEYNEVLKLISYLEDLLASPRRILMLVKTETEELKTKYGDARRTEIREQGVIDFSEEDLIPHQQVVVTLSQRGYVKRVPAQLYRLQRRGGKGVIGMVTREQDVVRLLAVADTHDKIYFFTNRGRVYCVKCHEIPDDSSRVGRGTALVNLFPVADGERVTAMVAASDFKPDSYLVMATRGGEVKKTAVEHFAQVRASGLIAMDLPPGDELAGAAIGNDQNEVLLVTAQGQSIKFPVSELRPSSRTSGGVRGIRLEANDRLAGMGIVFPEAYLLVVSVNGFGKITPAKSYPQQHRGGSGVLTFHVTDKTAELADAKLVSKAEQIVIISAEGIIMRTAVGGEEQGEGITVQGRSTQGVRLMRPESGDRVVAAASFE